MGDKMKKKTVIFSLAGVFICLFVIFVLGGSAANNAYRGIFNATAQAHSPDTGQNISGNTLFNVSITTNGTRVDQGANLSIGNVTFMWMLISNVSPKMVPANRSIMLNTTISNTTANQTLFNYTFNTSTLPEGLYNITLFIYNVSISTFVQSHVENSTFLINITIDRTAPRVNFTTPDTNGAFIYFSEDTKGQNRTFNVSVMDNVVGVWYIPAVIFQFSNGTGTPFNKTGTNFSGGWQVSVNTSSMQDGESQVVTVYALDSNESGGPRNLNKTVTFTSWTIDASDPSISLSKSESSTDSLTIAIATTGDAQQCTSTQGTVSGTGSSQTITATGLDSSTDYVFTVTCSDASGNTGRKTETFTTDDYSGGESSSGGSGSSGSGSGSGSTPTGATTGTGGGSATGRDAAEERTPSAAPRGQEEPIPGASAGEAEGAEAVTRGGSAFGWVIAVIVLVGLVVAYVVWSKKK
ncbi:MAG TPA: Ig-like domain-containing protein [Candidatus Nanoarchaeia archaeon]|nr:Ig-like domain-containing protein [Candidatus Nanoarchaeia archaeon]